MIGEKHTLVEGTSLNGVYIIRSKTFEDERGFFRETFRKNELEEIIGYPFNIVQGNHSRSKKNVLRGIHVAPWSKLIYCACGSIQEVIIDLKKDSPTFMEYTSIVISDKDKAKIFVPRYCGNSYLVLSEEADYIYLTDEYWQPRREIGIIWNDPSLNIDWHDDNPKLSNADKNNSLLKNVLQEIINAQAK